MNFRTRTLSVEQQSCEAITMKTITRVVPPLTIAAVVEEAGVGESNGRASRRRG